MLGIGMDVKIGIHNKTEVLAIITEILEDEVVAYCSHFNKPYYLCFKKENINKDFEVLEYEKLWLKCKFYLQIWYSCDIMIERDILLITRRNKQW